MRILASDDSSLGLGGDVIDGNSASSSNLRPVRESAVVSPSEMIAIGDAPLEPKGVGLFEQGFNFIGTDDLGSGGNTLAYWYGGLHDQGLWLISLELERVLPGLVRI